MWTIEGVRPYQKLQPAKNLAPLSCDEIFQLILIINLAHGGFEHGTHARRLLRWPGYCDYALSSVHRIPVVIPVDALSDDFLH